MEHLAVADDRFYLTNKYDKRGRTYSQGYHVNPQGADWNKGVIELADKELIAA
jgi:DNA-directed RNA polymerase